jgi:hypothetical protein
MAPSLSTARLEPERPTRWAPSKPSREKTRGLISLALNYILQHFNSSKNKEDWNICISFMQIYMEDIYDLFNPTNGKLQIRESLEEGETFVEDLVIVPI